jgi:dihydrofolate reductase
MGKLIVTEFMTLDGVAQAPGGPDEDRDGGFEHGGWQAPVFDEASGPTLFGAASRMDALLLGRRTYEIFADYWPNHTDIPIGQKLDELPKFVVSHTTFDPTWQGTTVLTDAEAEVAALKQRFTTTRVIGSGHLVQSLIELELLDRLNLYVYPITFGSGKSLFARGVPAAFTLAAPPRAFPKGAVLLSYDRAGAPITGIEIGA